MLIGCLEVLIGCLEVLIGCVAHLKAVEPVVVAGYSIADGARVPEIGLYADLQNRFTIERGSRIHVCVHVCSCVYRQCCLPFKKGRVYMIYST